MNEAAPLELVIVDLVLSFAVIEALVFAICCRRATRGPSFAALAPNLTAGLCLMLALRSALTADGWAALAGWLAAAGIAHGVDLWLRWRRSGSAQERRLQPAADMPLETSPRPVSTQALAPALSLPDVAVVDAICRQPAPAPRHLEKL